MKTFIETTSREGSLSTDRVIRGNVFVSTDPSGTASGSAMIIVPESAMLGIMLSNDASEALSAKADSL